MDPLQDSRLARHVLYPKMVYLETLILFFGANFLYHQNIYRHNWNKPQFAAFLFVNLFTSYQLVEATNVEAARYHAAIFNNTKEFEHRALMNQRLRLRLYNNTQ